MSDQPVELPACALCGGLSFATELREVRDLVWLKRGRFNIERCRDCGMVMTRPRPTNAALAYYYAGAYSSEPAPGAAPRRQLQLDTRVGRLIPRYRLRVLERVQKLKRTDCLLDVGCSYGAFLHTAHLASGCAASGIDLDPGNIAVAAGRDRDRIDYRVGRLDDTDYAPGAFTVITFYESLEHHSDPLAALRKALDLLAPGGLCVVEVPNFSGWWRAIARRSWLPLLVPQHLVHFTPSTLRRMVQAAGFGCIEHQQAMFFPLEGLASLVLALRGRWSPEEAEGGADPKPARRFGLLKLSALLVLAILYVGVEIPTQALLRLFGATGHQTIIARK